MSNKTKGVEEGEKKNQHRMNAQRKEGEKVEQEVEEKSGNV